MATKDQIKQIQQTLKNAGFDPGPIDGIIGPRTKSAANQYIDAARGQEELNNRRKQVGVVLGIQVEDKTTTPTGRNDVRNAQNLLKNAGFDPGPIDGIIGPLTRSAATRYIDSSKGKEELNKRRKEVGFIIGLKVEDTKPTNDDKEQEETEESEKTFTELIEEVEFGPSISADATNYEIDRLNKELGITDTALGSAIKRGFERASRGDMDQNDFNKLANDIRETVDNIKGPDRSLVTRYGAYLRAIALGAGVTIRGATAILEEYWGGLFNAGTDLIRPDAGGIGDAFFDAVMGNEPGTNAYSSWIAKNKPGYRYDSATNRFFNIETGEFVTSDNLNDPSDGSTPPSGNGGTGGTGGTGSGGTGAVDEGPLYWGRYDTGSWATSTKPGKPEGFKWAWELDEFPDKNEDLYTSDKSIEDILGLASVEEQEIISEDKIIVYRNGESREILLSDLALYQADGWSTTKPSPETGEPETEDEEDEVGPGQLVSDTLNEFNNVPRNSILIEAGGQLFLGYEVPGAYGQLYNGNPIFMLYEVLDNDVFEAGLLTQGASPQINVSLGSLEDLNQYGIIVGGTDELTDDVEHPFIRFTENFEAGKRVNPWLNDTEINPNTGVTYQQEAIEFLAEQSLEQWTPETTQIRYEGSDWYRKSTTAQKTWLTTLLTQPQQAQQDIQDKQIEVRASMEANGIASPPDALVSWIADKAVTGMWTQVYTDQQIALLADPYKPGTRDNSMVNFIEGVGVGTLDRLSVGEKTVRDLYRRYLGPSLGNASETEIAEKAGLLRSDPDAEEQLKAYLEQQRLAMFGKYTNPTLTYNDIVQPYKNLVNQVWGQEVDETQDWFIKMVQDNDIEKAYTTLRQKGMEQGVERVQDQALNDLQRGIGQGQVAPELGANR